MKIVLKIVALLCMSCAFHSGVAQAQAIKTNIPFLLAGTPNAGVEWNIGSRCSISGDAMWMPYMWNEAEEVFRALLMSADFRYYLKPKYYYTNKSYDGFYVGPYAMFGNYNIGVESLTYNKEENIYDRYVGWGLSAGLLIGHRLYLSNRLRLDFNINLGYAYLQYNTYLLGKYNASFAYSTYNIKHYIGPTKFGINLCYIIFK